MLKEKTVGILPPPLNFPQLCPCEYVSYLGDLPQILVLYVGNLIIHLHKCLKNMFFQLGYIFPFPILYQEILNNKLRSISVTSLNLDFVGVGGEHATKLPYKGGRI